VAKKPKVKVIKKSIPLKKTKVTKKTIVKIKKNLKTVTAKPISQKIEVKTDNLRISKSNEVKPEIKKVKKTRNREKGI
jgi:CarD family transcriptional regulator